MTSTTGELPKAYRPAEVEPGVLARWNDSGAFRADPAHVLSGEKQPYCILIPPPNVTGALHLGHALNNTIQDILIRAHRMMGYETLWIVGTDHAGIATQAVVERRLRKEGKLKGPLKDAMTREQFVALVQLWKDEYEATITGQLKAMGSSCDYARQRFTMDPICARAVREAFFRLFKDGLIYRGKRLVNWDPALQTAVADDECFEQDIDANFYYLRYPLVRAERDQVKNVQPVTWDELAARGYPHARQHPPEQQAWVTVATTRPETYLGDTAVAVNPHDPRAVPLRGLFVDLPLVGRIIPIVEDDYVVLPAKDSKYWPGSGPAKDSAAETASDEPADPKAQYATGFLKVTPAHDQNDYELGQRHKLPMVNMMGPDGTISDKHGWTDIGDAKRFVGMTREDARKHVIETFKQHPVGASEVPVLEDVKPYRHSVKHSDRSKAIVEPYLSDQWYVKVTDPRMAQSANEVLVAEQRSSLETSSGPGVPPGQSSGSSLTPKWAKPIGDALQKSQRELPHWEKGGSTYFITFRLLDGALSEEERQIVLDACKHWHDKRLRLHLVTIMPDHVHLLLQPLEKSPGSWYSLSELLHSIKSFSAHEIQKKRKQTGPFWQDEHFDRLIRDADEWLQKFVYMQNNPVKKGLSEKPWDYPYTFSPEREKYLEYVESNGAGTSTGRDARSAGGEKVATAVDRASRPVEKPGGTPGPLDGSNTLRFYPARYAKTFEHWHDNIRDWCISRQLWWGHQIPVWSSRPGLHPNRNTDDWMRWCTEQYESGNLTTRQRPDTNELDYIADRSLASHFLCFKNPPDADGRRLLAAAGYEQDPDVLDTWFSSALWPLSTLGWPDPDQSPETKGLLEAFNPTSVLSTAREIITLWVSRMVMMNRYLLPSKSSLLHLVEQASPPASPRSPSDFSSSPFSTGPVPFHDVFIHAVVQDGEGKRMSKSAGNGVDPLDIISSHGADALRFTLCQMTTQTQDVRMPVTRDPTTNKNTSPKFDTGRNFCNKLWNAARFALGMLTSAPSSPRSLDPLIPRSLPLVDRWMLSRLTSTLTEVNASLKEYQFAGYAQAMYDILWRDFCDWYLEAIKPTVAENAGQRAVLAHSLETIVRLLHPVTPFVTEALWEHLRNIDTAPVAGFTLAPSRVSGLLATAGWPILESSLRDEAAERDFGRVQNLVNMIREVRAQHQVVTRRRITLHAPIALIDELRASGGLAYVESLAGLEIAADAAASTASATLTATIRFESFDLLLSNLAEKADAGAEKERLERELADRTKAVSLITKRLENPGYMAKAPAKLVEESKAQLAAFAAEIKLLTEQLEKMG